MKIHSRSLFKFKMLAMALFLMLSWAASAFEFSESKLGNLPFKYNTIPQGVYAKAPALIYLAVDTTEPFMKIAIDQEIFQLRELCHYGELETMVVVGSKLGAQLKQGSEINIEGCHLKKWEKFDLQPETQSLIVAQIKNYRGPLSKGEIEGNPLSLKPVFEGILDEIFARYLKPESFSFFFHIKSHGGGVKGIEYFDQATQDRKFAEQIATLGISREKALDQFGSKLELGSGRLIPLFREFQKKGGHLGDYQNDQSNTVSSGAQIQSSAKAATKSAVKAAAQPKVLKDATLSNNENMFAAPSRGDLESSPTESIAQEDLAKMFERFHSKGVNSLFVYQESCNSRVYHSPNSKDRFPIMDSVYNYYRASGLLAYHNLDWKELGTPNTKSADLLFALISAVGMVNNKFPDDIRLNQIIFELAHQNLAEVAKIIATLDGELVKDFILYKDLIRELTYYLQLQTANEGSGATYKDYVKILELMLKKAFERVDFSVLPEAETQRLFGQTMNPFYFNNVGFHLMVQNDVKVDQSFRSAENPRWRRYQNGDVSAKVYILTMNYLLAKMGLTNIRQLNLKMTDGSLQAVHHFWIEDLNSYFLSSNRELLSMFQNPINTRLDIGLFEWVVAKYGLPVDYRIDEKNKPRLLGAAMPTNKSGSVLIQNGDRLVFGKRNWSAIPGNKEAHIVFNSVDERSPLPLANLPRASGTEIVKNFYRTVQYQGLTLAVHDKSFGDSKSGFMEYKITDYQWEAPVGIVVQKDGRTVVLVQLIGKSSLTSTPSGFALFRINADGSRDSSFGGRAGVTLIEKSTDLFKPDSAELIGAQQITEGADGSLFVKAVSTSPYSTALHLRIYKFDTEGSLDMNFGDSGNIQVKPIGDLNFLGNAFVLPLKNGKLLVGSWYVPLKSNVHWLNYFTNGILGSSIAEVKYLEPATFRISRFNADGSVDTGFGPNQQGWIAAPNKLDMEGAQREITGADGELKEKISFRKDVDLNADVIMAEQDDGKLLVNGSTMNDGERAVQVTRFLQNGGIDPEFGEEAQNHQGSK